MPFPCPHCKQQANIRSSRYISNLTREEYYRCSNLACGCRFKMLSQITQTLVQSANPDPEVAATIPYTPLEPGSADWLSQR